MSKPNNPKKRHRTWLRWTFIVLIVSSLVYMSLKTASFLQEAEMALGRKPLVVNPELSDLLINSQAWTAPADSALQQAQIHYLIRIASAIDSLDAKGATTNERRRTIAQIMNQHMMTRASYKWIRSNTIDFALKAPSTRSDSANHLRFKMLIPLVKQYEHVFDRNLDKEITE